MFLLQRNEEGHGINVVQRMALKPSKHTTAALMTFSEHLYPQYFFSPPQMVPQHVEVTQHRS
jgi:hypothetical protein